ncbi:helix-turn-helix transcriptional regulator [Maribacter sp. X9]|uniref:helix-turn-helix transcriptional regulator n=1 Tax=Maribacter sp. X9 TaxID=3402159 RepID=UPI003AF34EF9
MEPLNRFDRIVAIFTHLQSGRIIRAQDLSERFNVSLRTIYRDIRTLETSGVPISGEAGVGYSIMEGYRLPPIMFTLEEATSFVTAEKLMQHFTDKQLGGHFKSAMYKVKSVLRGKSKDQITALQSKIWITPAQDLFNDKLPDALEIVMQSMAEKKQVKIQYRAFIADDITERVIEPVALYHENNYWYIKAWCHLRLAYRQFRTDRMIMIARTTLPFSQDHTHQERKEQHEDWGTLTKVVIRMAKDKARFIQNSRKYYGFESEQIIGEQVEMVFMTDPMNSGIARWFVMFGDCAEILEPPILKQYVKDILRDIQKNLQMQE